MFDFNALIGGEAAMGAQASIPVTNLAPHVDGGDSPVSTKDIGSADQQETLWYAAGIVVAAIVLLWFFGGFALRGLPSI